MASVRQSQNGKRIEIRMWHQRERSTTIPYSRHSLTRTRRIADQLEQRLKLGQSTWEEIRAELRGESLEVVTPESLNYYMQHVFTTSTASLATLKKNKRDYDRVWKPDFAHRPIDGLVRSELQKRLASFNYTPETQRDLVSLLRQAYEVAKGDGILEKAPTDGWKIKGNSRGKNKVKRAYTPDQRDKLLKALKSKAVDSGSIEETAWRFFTLAFYSGMRTEELLAIEKRHLGKYRILIDQVRTDNRLVARTKSENSERWVDIPKWVWDEVVAPWQWRDWLFTGPKGKPFTQGNKMMAEYQRAHDTTGIVRPMNRTGRMPMPYPWRSTYISQAISNGMDPLEVANQVGDDPRTIFMHYVEFIDKQTNERTVDTIFGDRRA